jgi:dolichol-phosphate mannosyltransferase
MTTKPGWQARALGAVAWLTRIRYLKFGLVGASGTVVNIAVLYLGHEYLFQAFEGPRGKPYASLALAIAVATVNNFTWNRLWTWADRVEAQRAAALDSADVAAPKLGAQLAKYALASWFGIALQYALTLWLAHVMHYMLANVIAIVLASVSNFLANDRWTFRRR